jgi:hypothetical protein
MHDQTPGARGEGELLLDGQNIYDATTDAVLLRRRVGMVFQRPNAFAKSIFDNVAFGLQIIAWRDRAQIAERVEHALPRVVHYDEETIEFESIEPAGGEGTNRWFRVESRRAHRRAAVRALFESRGLQVSRVIQVQFADIELPRDLPRGRHRQLPPARVEALYALAELELPQAESKPKPRGRRAATGRKKSRR